MKKLKPWEQGIPSSELLSQTTKKTKNYKPSGRGFLSGYVSTNKLPLFPIIPYKNKINPWNYGLIESEILSEKIKNSILYRPIGRGMLSRNNLHTNRYYYSFPYILSK